MSSPILSSPFIPRILFLLVVSLVVLAGFVTLPFEPVSGKVSHVEALTDDGQVTRERASSAPLFSVDGVERFPGFLAENGSRLFSPFGTAWRRITALTYSAPLSPPTVSLTTPTNNAKFIAGSTIALAANASDPDGTVSKVEFFQGAVKLGEDTTAPYDYQWTNVPAADYVITARATDNVGESTVSAPINIAVLAQVKQYVGWSSISNGTDLGNGSLRKDSIGAWDFGANSLQKLLPGDGYFEATAVNYNQSISIEGVNWMQRAIIIGSGGWVGIYENGQEIANTQSGVLSPHAAGDRYRLEIVSGVLRYIRYRGSVREVMFTSPGPLPDYPIYLGLGMSPQNAEWQKAVMAQLTRKATWSSITNGIDLGNGSVRKTSTGVWDFAANAAQTLLRGDGYFESTASYFNQSINLGGSDGQGRALVVGTGGWAAVYENGQEVANTSPLGNLTPHAAGDRYRLEIASGVLRYVRYRSGVRVVLYTSTNALPAYPLGFGLGASFQNSEWQDTVITQLSQVVTWSFINNGIDLGNGSVRNTSNGVWDFAAGPRQQQFYSSGYFESTASYYNHSINLWGADSAGRALLAGTGGWAAIYENGQEVANTSPIGNVAPHAAGDRYRLELSRGKLRYVRYRGGIRSIQFTSTNPIPTFPISFSLGMSFQNSEWQNTIFSDNVPEYNNALFVSQTVPATMVPGQNYNVSVTFRNNGTSTWTPDGDYQLASENLPDNLRWGINRVNLTTTVMPGSDGVFNFTVTAPPNGSHSFQWRMVQQGVERFGALSTNVNVQTVNGAPTVSLTSPANNATFTAPATVALSASASDSDGTVSKVEFFQGAVKLGEDTTSPYTYNWTSVSAGSYVLTARATDNGGATAGSAAVNITVNPPNEAPTVSLTSPANNALFTAVATVAISANAADSDGVINKVEFFQGATKLGEDTSAPFTFNWTNVAAGSYVLTAKATDNLGAVTTSSPVNIVVNQPPTVSLISPANNAVFTAVATVPFSANASDTDGTISKVEFFQGATKLGEDTSAPFTFNWTNVAAGSYVLTARATDNLGAVTTSSPVNIVVNQPPTVSLITPANNAVFTAVATVPFSANASDSDGTISKVEFFQGATKLGEDTSAPFTFNWTNVAAGSYVLTAKATDNRSATTTSSVVNIIVNQPPAVSLTSPPNNGVFAAGGTVLLGANASDSDGTVSKVEFFQGVTKLGEDTIAPYNFNWTNVAAGSYALSARVTDNLGATTNSNVFNIIVNAPPVANAGGPYTGTIGSPIQFNGSGSDADGSIVSYQWNFGDGSTTSVASPTHSYASAGPFTATLTVTDNLNATGNATAAVSVSEGTIARLDPSNRTGGGGEDPLSRNYNWSTPLVALPGRAGLNLELSLTYNSLATWTRNGTTMTFDDDRGFPSVGFRLGFPVIQPQYFNSQVNGNAFMLIGSDGSRTELRQVGSSSLYEAADSSYMLLDSNTMILRTRDGTQFSYVMIGIDFQCTQIKDRNGNFITVNYTSFGRISSVVDTVGRVLTFNYDGTYLQSITQPWNGVTHYWASFEYYPAAQIQTSFPGLINLGPQNGSTLKVLSKVVLNDHSSFVFDYTFWGQIWKITNRATDNHVLNYRAYNLPGNELTPQSDCPRFTQRHDYAENWNRSGADGPAGMPAGPEQEVLVGEWLVPEVATWPMPGGLSQSGLRTQFKGADSTKTKIYFEGAAGTDSGWKRGLPSLIETFDINDVRQRQTVTSWTQDNTTSPYIRNPRVLETNIYDPQGNRARTTIHYRSETFIDGSTCKVPDELVEFKPNGTSAMRHTHTGYNFEPAYTSRHILGLVEDVSVYQVDGSTETLVTKNGFTYDGVNSIDPTGVPIQHDNALYGAGFVNGRANLSRVTRIDVNNVQQFTTTTMQFNIAGATVASFDAANHRTLISYEDKFSDENNSRNTFAYQTTVTDPDNGLTTAKYNFDFGVATRTTEPPPAEQAFGKIRNFTYDSIGRLLKSALEFNGTSDYNHIRFVYDDSQIRVDTYSTIKEGPEAHSFTITDGYGRTIANVSDHPGSSGGFSAKLVLFDKVGRAVKTSNPTETTAQIIPGQVVNPAQWAVAGDDLPVNGGLGWLYTQQTYDWKDRPLVTTNTDNTTKSASYDGCGCAGGEVITVTDEGTLVDIDPGLGIDNVTKRRQRKVYNDRLGRAVKSQVLIWNGTGPDGTNGSVYSTTINDYNTRDQITSVRKFQGVGPSDPNDMSCPGGSIVSTIATDRTWKQSTTDSNDWSEVWFDDSKWEDAVEEGGYGESPWTQYTGFPQDTPAQWIWSYDTRKANDITPAIYVRKTFVAPSSSATLTIIATEGFHARLNGIPIANGNFNDPTQKVPLTLTPGDTYVVAVFASNTSGPAGLLAHLEFTDGVCQQTVMEYDGYGRLQSKRQPEQQPGTATTYTYNPDDSLNTVRDARGSITTFGYNNNRKLPTTVSYTPSFGVANSATISTGYDAVGNKTFVNDGSGNATYHYDQLSRLTSEARTFAGLGFTQYGMAYAYNPGGELKTMVYNNGATITYDFDSMGRSIAVSGPLINTIDQYVDDIKYRAFGGRRRVHYGDTDQLVEIGYNKRLQVKKFNLKTAEYQGQRYDDILMEQDYTDDGNKAYLHDLLLNTLNRNYTYDFAGRLSFAAGAGFGHNYGYDAFNNQTNRLGGYWSRPDSFAASYVNGRNQNTAYHYDDDGRVRFDNDVEYRFDARGINVTMKPLNDTSTTNQVVDFEGQIVKRTQAHSLPYFTRYYLRSTVLGGKVVSEVSALGALERNYVYLDGEKLVTLDNNAVIRPMNPLTGGTTDINPDTTGMDVGFTDPYDTPAEEPHDPDLASLYPGVEFPDGRCRVNGIIFPCALAMKMFTGGTAIRCPNDDCDAHNLVSEDDQGNPSHIWKIITGNGFWLSDGTDSAYSFEILDGADVNNIEYTPLDSNRTESWHLPSFPFGPQNSGFQLYGPGFTDEQMKILVDSLSRIRQKDCTDFINATLAKYKVGKDVDSLDKLLKKGTLGRYDVNADYQTTDLGVDFNEAMELYDVFVNRGWTAASKDNRVFLSDKAFSRTKHYWYKNVADTSSIIVHELFHVAGIDEKIVDSQELTTEIQKHCWTRGSDLINMVH